MSFWDNVKKFAQPYSEDDDYDYDDEDDYEEEEEAYEEPVQKPTRRSSRRSAPQPSAPAPMEDKMDDLSFGGAPVISAPAASSANNVTVGGFSGQVLSMNNSSVSNKQEVVLFRPGSFNDTSKAADDLRSHKAVVVNMENVDKAMARRVVDFLSGCVYALDGDVKKIAQSAYLFCPHNMNIVGDLETLQAEVESYI